MGHNSREQVENYVHLRARFGDRLLAQQPVSVLDVGCGDGALLWRCQEAGVRAIGMESTDRGVASMRSQGFEVLHGVAERIPLADGACDWVTLRHVPHHLANPAAGLAEALRVCRSGIVVAEPWFDPRIPSQRNALEADRWLKRQDRRAGRVHEESLDTAALMAALPADRDYEVDADIVLRLRARPLRDLEAEAAPLLDALPPDDPDRAAFAELCAAVERDGLSWNGSVILSIRPRVTAD